MTDTGLDAGYSIYDYGENGRVGFAFSVNNK